MCCNHIWDNLTDRRKNRGALLPDTLRELTQKIRNSLLGPFTNMILRKFMLKIMKVFHVNLLSADDNILSASSLKVILVAYI